MWKAVIDSNKKRRQSFSELKQYRELFFFLAWKNIMVRYKQTIFGIAWALVRPVVTMIVFSIIFGRLAKLPSGNVPYPILVYAAMLPWQFFSATLKRSGNSLIGNVNMISKVYFPRIIIPTSTVIVSIIDFLLSFTILIILMVFYGFYPDWKVIILPALLVLAALTSLGIGYWISALNVRYRDFRYILPFIVQLGLLISPVGFSSEIVPSKWRMIYSLNPLVGVIDGFRWALLGGDVRLYAPGLLYSSILAILLFASGIWFFDRVESGFADVI